MQRLSPRIRSQHFFLEYMPRNVFHKFTEICMETPCWCLSTWAPTWRPEMAARNQQKHLSLSFDTKRGGFISRRTQKRNNNILLYARTVQIAEIPDISHFLTNQHHSSLARHVNATSRKSLEIQVWFITKPRTHSE